ncbi:hypothetical protein ACJJTC_000418 [Scirpophaga incertulas]
MVHQDQLSTKTNIEESTKMEQYDINSLLQNIFTNKEATNGTPAGKIPLVMKEIEILKNDLRTCLNSNDYDLGTILKESNDLCDEAKSLICEIELCKQETEEVTKPEILSSIEDHDKITKELQSVDFALNIVCDVVQCGKYVTEFDDGREAQSFTRAVEALYDLLQFIEMTAEGFKQLDLYNNIKHTAQLILDSLLTDLNVEWDRLVTTSLNASDAKTIVVITLGHDGSRFIIDVLNALDKCNQLKDRIEKFGQFLLNEVLIPIVHNDTVVFAESAKVMSVTIHNRVGFQPPYNAVIANLRLLFHFLSNKLNTEHRTGESVLSIVGKQISEIFCDVLVQDCLIHTVPNNINELQSYGKITSEIEDFQHFLLMVKFFPNKRISILHYIDNIDVLFASKSSEYFLETARTIMLKDLSDTMSIGVESIPKDDPECSSDNLDENEYEAVKVLEEKIPKSLFYFPRCMISKSAQELINLVYAMMEQAVQCSDVVCKKQYVTTRLVFELYDAIVPYHHEKYLKTIPQYIALFHNNCMYLAHNLQTFGDKWLILMEGRELDYPISFVDLVQKMRDLAYKHFSIHMQQQRSQILDNIRSSDLNSIVARDELSDNAEAAVRQCLRQLHLLKNVWIGVFPSNVFKNVMATLVDMFVAELIHRVCAVEDISMEMAVQLTDIYNLVIQKAPLLFQNSNDIIIHVKSWAKLQHLIFILGGSLKDIENQWQDGKGPLAVHFTKEQLRNLIKALFQNTQFRASLLAKIKN